MTFGDTNEDCNRETQKEFYGHLSAELIDNTYDFVGGRRAVRVSTPPAIIADSAVICNRTGAPRSGQTSTSPQPRGNERISLGSQHDTLFKVVAPFASKKPYINVRPAKMSRLTKTTGGSATLLAERCAFRSTLPHIIPTKSYSLFLY